MPIKVNGVTFNFLLDTGIEETILFSLDERKEIPLFDVEKIKLKGLGTQEAVEGLKAYQNTLSVEGLQLKNQEIIVVLDQDCNFSSALGVEVNGIIGFHFFSQSVVKIDYSHKKIIIFNPEKFQEQKVFRKFKAFDFQLEDAKPYLTVQVQINGNSFDAKCLIDSGNSDGLWLFQSKSDKIIVPERNFEDYLGRGFSGDVFGKKARVETLSFADYQFENVVTAFPDELAFVNLKMIENRLGSIGGEFLRRFNLIFDYRKQKLYLQKSKYYDDKFRYNTTGITIHHAGLQWYKEELPVEGFGFSRENPYKQNVVADLKYNFTLLPKYEILAVRKNSPAAIAGLLAGDILISINERKSYRMSLDKINQLLKKEDQEEVTILISREGKERSFRFKLVDLL